MGKDGENAFEGPSSGDRSKGVTVICSVMFCTHPVLSGGGVDGKLSVDFLRRGRCCRFLHRSSCRYKEPVRTLLVKIPKKGWTVASNGTGAARR